MPCTAAIAICAAGDSGFNIKLGSHKVKYLLLDYGAIFLLIFKDRQLDETPRKGSPLFCPETVLCSVLGFQGQ